MATSVKLSSVPYRFHASSAATRLINRQQIKLRRERGQRGNLRASVVFVIKSLPLSSHHQTSPIGDVTEPKKCSRHFFLAQPGSAPPNLPIKLPTIVCTSQFSRRLAGVQAASLQRDPLIPTFPSAPLRHWHLHFFKGKCQDSY